jgi:hypothetical protein
MRLKWKLGSVRLGIVQLLMQNWCTVCVERTLGSEIVLEAPDGSPRHGTTNSGEKALSNDELANATYSTKC